MSSASSRGTSTANRTTASSGLGPPGAPTWSRPVDSGGGTLGPTRLDASHAHAPGDVDVGEDRVRDQQWAALMQRNSGSTSWRAPKCGGRLRLSALIEEAAVVGRILRHLGVPAEIPPPRPARAPPVGAPAADVGNWDDLAVFTPCS